MNSAFAAQIAGIPGAVVYGENIDNGSRISGLTRDFEAGPGGRIMNVGDCEATHCGVGFGLMLSRVPALLFAKQLDFMLLGVEHFVNTYNFVRSQRDRQSLGSFTIVAVVCDQGFQGPQSSFNALGDICSLARVPGYTVTNSQDTPRVIQHHLNSPGFRFICVSQRLFPTEFIDLDLEYAADDCSLFKYYEGEGATIVCYNFSLPEGLALRERIVDRGASASLFSANYVHPMDWSPVAESLSRTGKLVVFDDSKSSSLFGHTMVSSLLDQCPPFQKIVVSREDDLEFGVSPDNLRVDYEGVLAELQL